MRILLFVAICCSLGVVSATDLFLLGQGCGGLYSGLLSYERLNDCHNRYILRCNSAAGTFTVESYDFADPTCSSAPIATNTYSLGTCISNPLATPMPNFSFSCTPAIPNVPTDLVVSVRYPNVPCSGTYNQLYVYPSYCYQSFNYPGATNYQKTICSNGNSITTYACYDSGCTNCISTPIPYGCNTEVTRNQCGFTY